MSKRQRSAPTTPRSTSSIHPHEYDEVMGITQVEPRDAERFEEGNDSDFQDAEETATRETETGDKAEPETRGRGEIHGGVSSATLRECIERVLQQSAVATATLHSGEGIEKSSDPPQFATFACFGGFGGSSSPSKLRNGEVAHHPWRFWRF